MYRFLFLFVDFYSEILQFLQNKLVRTLTAYQYFVTFENKCSHLKCTAKPIYGYNKYYYYLDFYLKTKCFFIFLAFRIPKVLAVHSRAVYRIDHGGVSVDCYFRSGREQVELYSGTIQLRNTITYTVKN